MVTLARSEEHTSELQSPKELVCRLLLEKKKGMGARERVGVRVWGGGGVWGFVACPTPSLLRFFMRMSSISSLFFFFNDTATTEIYTLSLHDALPIRLAQSRSLSCGAPCRAPTARWIAAFGNA